MGRIICIDYGRKRCGIAVTDPLKICANGLPTVRTCDLLSFLSNYFQNQDVETVIVGEPLTMSGEKSESAKFIDPFVKKLEKLYPDMQIKRFDERFTSSIAHREMITGGLPKNRRQEKGLTDEISAVIILTSYLESRSYKEQTADPKSDNPVGK